MWCVSSVDERNAASMDCRPSERLDRLDSDGHRQRAKTRHRSRMGLQFLSETNRCPFADIFIRSLIDAMVSLAENGHFDVVLRFAPQWRVHTRNDKWTADTEHRLSRQNTMI